jgi:hypothetical protein
MMATSEHGNELTGSIKWGQFQDGLCPIELITSYISEEWWK